MAEETTRPTEPLTSTQQNPPTQPKRAAGTAPPLASRETPSSSGKKCEVLKDSCKEPATWIAKSPDGAEIYVCDEHKPLVTENYPGIAFEFEEL